jgi:tetratricopeptide (TPR) repeat protein
LEKFDNELPAIEKQISEEGYSPDVCLKYGLALHRQGRTDEAREAFSRGLSLDPFHVELRHQRARKSMATNYWQAISDYSLAARLKPEYWEIWYYMGVTYYFVRDYSQSLACFLTCLDKGKGSGDSLIPTVDWLWTVSKQLGLADAGKYLDLVDENAPLEDEDNYAYYRRILLYKGKLDPDHFFDHGELKRRGGSDADFVTQAYGLANWRRFRGEMKEAGEILRQIREHPGMPGAFAYILAARDIQEFGFNESLEIQNRSD